MSERKRIFLLISIMTAIVLVITSFTIFFLYKAAIHEEKKRLVETVKSQARIIEAMVKFDAEHSQSYSPGGARGATLIKITAAHNNYEQSGMTTEFTLAERDGEWISFLIRHRHGGLEEYLQPVAFDSELAVPMQKALSGESGTIIAEDYRGVLVMAAYEPVAEYNLGIVAKIDLSEIRAPYIRAGLISGLLAVLMVGIGATLFVRVSYPMIRTIHIQNATLFEANKTLQKEIGERLYAEEALEKAHSELEKKVKRRTAELTETNTLLEKEIHDRKAAEQQLIQKEKLSALGVMVSSMAHEINNPNSFISFNIPILRDYIHEMLPIVAKHANAEPEFEVCNLSYPEFEQDILKLLSNIENGSRRISSVISNLRESSHDKR